MRFFLILISSFLTFHLSLQAQTEDDEQAVRSLVAQMTDGWNNGSGEDYSAPFAEAHTYIVWDGQYYANSNRISNAAAHNGLFEGIYKSTQLHATVDKLTFLRPDIAMIYVLAALAKADEARSENPEVLISIVASKEDGEWQIVSFHNSDLEMFQSPNPEEASPMPLQYMFGSWYAAER